MALARWQANIVDDAGNVLPGAQVTVRREVAGQPLAVLFTDRDGVVSAGNPVAADPTGYVFFHVVGGAYRIDATFGTFTRTWRYVAIGEAAEYDVVGVPALVQEVDAGYALTFESATSAPPSAGAIRFNNANLSLASSAFVSGVNLAGSSIEARLLELFSASRTVKDTFSIADPESGQQASFQIGGATDSGAYVTLTVGAHAGATSFTNGERVNFQPNRAGADGAAGILVGARERLTVNRTYYVRSDGSDSNNGLVDSAGGAFLTVQKAADVVYGTLDLAGFNVDIQVRDGTFARGVVARPQVGPGNITLRGNSGTPANVILTATGIGTNVGVVDVRNGAVLHVQDLSLTTVTSGDCLLAASQGVIYHQNTRFGACAGNHIQARVGGLIETTGNYAITAGAGIHYRATIAGIINSAAFTVTITGTPAFSDCFAQALLGGVLNLSGQAYSGSATGLRFRAFIGGIVNSASLTDIAGNVAGTVATGGVHNVLVDYATDAQIRAATAGKFMVSADLIASASVAVSLTDAATVAVDWSTGVNFDLVLAGNRVLGNPTNAQPGTWRTVRVSGNDATLRTLTFGNQYFGNLPTINDATGSPTFRQYLVSIFCVSSTHFVPTAIRAL